MVQVSQSMIMLWRVNPAADIYSRAMSPRVAANLIIGADGSTTLAGSSRALSFAADRRRFHQLRGEFNAILIGGATARTEPYKNTPLPLIVLTHGDLPLEVATNPRAQAWQEPLALAIPRATRLFGDVLLEVGPTLLQVGLEAHLITELFLTVSDATGGENFIDMGALVKFLEELTREKVVGGLFLSYRLAPSHR